MSEPAIFFMMMLVVAHVLTVYWITQSSHKVVEECRKVVLEREETDRLLYAKGPDFPDSDKANSLEVK